MSLTFGKLTFEPAINHPELVTNSVTELLKNWTGETQSSELLISEIDPEFADSLAFCEKYEIKPEDGANCIIVRSKRAGEMKYAACLVPIDKRADVNGIIKKHLNAADISFAPKDFAVEATGMEYGSITVVGLPKDWQILIDESLLNMPYLILGGSLRKSKLLIPGKMLAELPNVSVLDLTKK